MCVERVREAIEGAEVTFLSWKKLQSKDRVY